MKHAFIFLVMILSTSFLSAEVNDGWTIETKKFDRYNGITLANGCIGIVSGKEPFSISEIVLNNVFDRDADSGISCTANAPLFMSLGIKINGIMLKCENINIYSQRLNMREATLDTHVENNDVDINYRLMAVGNLPYMAMGIVDIYAKKDIEIEVFNNVSGDERLTITDKRFKMMTDLETISPVFISKSFTNGNKEVIATCSAFLFDNTEDLRKVHGDGSRICFNTKLRKGAKYRFALIGSVCSSRYFSDPLSASERIIVFALRKKTSELFSGHVHYWDEMWKGDIEINGNVEDQRDVRLALYHLYSFQRKNFRLSIPPMGLSSAKGYNGHIFWDSEIWMFPPVLLLNTSLAKGHVDYRYDRLKEARHKAMMFGYGGAMYPWESDDSGEESTPSWCMTGPFEHHISADVAIAFWNYYCVTKDIDWLRKEGYKVIKEVADFWVSRVEKNDDGSYSIRNVVGANEYAHNVDDNAYTNGAAKVALSCATKAARALCVSPDTIWMCISDNIRFHYMDDGTIKEHAVYKGEKIKQADVNLLAFPLNIVKDKKSIERDLVYYKDRIDEVNGPAMSNSILSILYSKIGDRENAYRMFKKSYLPNKRPPFGVLSESPSSDNPYFATGAGGLLQAVLFGFAGIEITDDGIVKGTPLLPRSWKSLRIKGLYGYDEDYVITNKH